MEMRTQYASLHDTNQICRILAIFLGSIAALRTVPLAPIVAAIASNLAYLPNRGDEPFGVSHSPPRLALDIPPPPHGGNVHAIRIREFPGLICIRLGHDPGWHASVIEAPFI